MGPIVFWQFRPLLRGCSLSEVKRTIGKYPFGTLNLVLCSEVISIVSFIGGSTVYTLGIPGLYLTGQDIFTCGFSGAMFGGLLCAMAMTKRNLMGDLIELTKKVKKGLKKKEE